MTKTLKAAMAAAIVLTAGAALAAPSAADKCQASKNKVAGAYYACREKADATAISKGGSPDYSKCAAKFGYKWDGAETAGAGMCPDNIVMTADVDAYIAGQATDAAAIVAGTKSIPTCGDGSINAAGEHCDGIALDGYTCASFGFHGTLTCTPGCDLDLSGCTTCPAPGIEYGGACWVLGAVEADCDAACATLGLVYDDATSIIAGSEGSDANCTALLDLAGATGVGLDNPSAVCTFALGCAVYSEFGYRARCASPPTDSSTYAVGIQRVCACR